MSVANGTPTEDAVTRQTASRISDGAIPDADHLVEADDGVKAEIEPSPLSNVHKNVAPPIEDEAVTIFV